MNYRDASKLQEVKNEPNQLFRSANVSMDPFWASVLLQAIRFVLVFMGLPITGKFKKKVVYLTCCGISCLGTLTLATYSYLNMDKQLTSSYPWTGYIPLFAIVLMYIAFAFGLGTIPFMLQVFHRFIILIFD